MFAVDCCFVFSEIVESMLFQEQVYLIKKITMEMSTLHLSGSLLLFGSYAKRTFKEDSDIDLFYLGTMREAEITKIKAIGKIYGKIIHIKTATIKNFVNGLQKKDAFVY